MRLRTKFVGSGIVIAVLVLITWMALPTAEPRQEVGLGVASSKRGRYGGLHADFIAIASVTNKTRFAIGLGNPFVRWEYQEGRIIINAANMWNGKDSSIPLPPNGVTELPIGLPSQVKRFRVYFEYTRDGGRARMTLSRGVRKLPVKLLPKSVSAWLLKNGLLDGYLHGQYESPWMSSPSETPGERAPQ